ncbi:MAG: CBS domain-containing protein [Gemmatimonadetes bacterium]|nr:CBS domain-containing protein [Gemmatimonadota bacterium]NNM06875.1 CBS domain-containing protein [Gemmatimonadota bacterium]
MGRLVEDVMQREVVTVTPETPVRTLLKRLVSAQISGVPVVTGAGDIVGVVSTTDLVRLGAGEKELNAAELVFEPLVLPNEEYPEESMASFYMDALDWRYPTETQSDALPEGVFDGYTVSDIMTRAAFTVKPKDTVRDAGKFMLKGRIHRALVVEDEQLLGIVTAFDLLKAFVEE